MFLCSAWVYPVEYYLKYSAPRHTIFCPHPQFARQNIIPYNRPKRDIYFIKPTTVKKGAPPRYDNAFKQRAVKLVAEQGRLTADVAAELGVSADSLRTWLKTAGVVPAQADRSNKDAKRFYQAKFPPHNPNEKPATLI